MRALAAIAVLAAGVSGMPAAAQVQTFRNDMDAVPRQPAPSQEDRPPGYGDTPGEPVVVPDARERIRMARPSVRSWRRSDFVEPRGRRVDDAPLPRRPAHGRHAPPLHLRSQRLDPYRPTGGVRLDPYDGR